jgi:hypothetical protein
MKKFKVIVGSIFSFVGFVCFVTAQSVISGNHRYSWRPPYTTYEAQILMAKWIGLILLLCGILDLAMVVFSHIYTQKTVQDPTSNQVTMLKCPSCGLSVKNTTEVCPRCNTKIK